MRLINALETIPNVLFLPCQVNRHVRILTYVLLICCKPIVLHVSRLNQK